MNLMPLLPQWDHHGDERPKIIYEIMQKYFPFWFFAVLNIHKELKLSIFSAAKSQGWIWLKSKS